MTIAIAIIAGVGLVAALALAIADKYLAVREDPRIGMVTAALPGANCGGCGFPGCDGYARALVAGTAPNGACAAGGDACAAAIAKILGVEATATEKRVALVKCCGTRSEAIRVGDYNGICDCSVAAMTAGGDKGCTYGCLGYGACANVCPKHAISIVDGLAKVDKRLCIGCGKCVNVCPRKLIRLVPAAAPIHVYCNSLEKPAKRRKFCKNPCLACKKCIRTDENHMQMQGGLVRVNYSNPPEASFVEQVKCPTGALQVEEIHRKIAALKPAEPAPKAAPAPKKEESK